MTSINYMGHNISLEGMKDGQIVFYIDTNIVLLPNFAALDNYLININDTYKFR